MEINFCSPSFFFNQSQKFPFLVYDFRDQMSGCLKNTIPAQYVSELTTTADFENYLTFPEQASEKKKLQTLFKNRRRNINFFVLFASSDMFTLFINEEIRKLSSNQTDKFTVTEDQVFEWCSTFQSKYMKKQQKRGVRAQTVRVKQEQPQDPYHHQMSQVNIEDPIQYKPSTKAAMEYDGKPVLYLPSGHDKVQQVQIKERSNSAPSKLTLEVQKPTVSNFELFTMMMCLYQTFVQEKFQSLYIFLEPVDIIFKQYPFLNYSVPRNKLFLDKSFPNEILENQLYLGAAEHARDVEMLEDQLRITHVLNVTIEVKNFSEKINYLNIKIYDEPQVQISDHFEEAFQFIDNAITNGGKVLVHCAQGKSRSACMVTMYLIRKKGWSFEQAYDYVRERREIVQINDGFITQLEKL